MNFLAPWMLLGLLAAAVPIVLHLLNRQRAQRVRFPMLTIVSISKEQRARALKIKRWLLLAARIALMLLIPLAMAQPYAKCGSGPSASDRHPSAVVIIVDVSASMGRVQDKDVRKEAQKLARGAIQKMRSWDQVRVLAAGQSPQWLTEQWSNDTGAALKAIDNMKWEEGRSSLPHAMQEAMAALLDVQQLNRKIVVITDNDAQAWTSRTLEPDSIKGIGELTVLPIDIDSTSFETSLDELQWQESAGGDANMFDIDATVRAYGTGKQKVTVSLDIDGKRVSAKKIDLSAGNHEVVRFSHTFEGDGVHAVRASVDGYGVRGAQERWMPIYLSRAIQVLLVNGDNQADQKSDELYYLTRALAVDLGERQNIRKHEATPGRLDAKTLEQYDVVLLANVKSIDAKTTEALRKFVRNGGGLWITPGSHVEPDMYNQMFGDLLPQPLRSVSKLAEEDDPDANIRTTRFANIDYNSALFRVFSMPGGESLQSVRVFQYVLLKPATANDAHVVATYADGGPAVVEKRYGSGRILLWTTTIDKDWSDLPIRTAYVPLVHRTMHYLAQQGVTDSMQSEVGQTLSFDLAGITADSVEFTTQNGARFVLPVEHDVARMTPMAPGMYKANMVYKDESTRAPALDFGLNVPRDEARYLAVEEAIPEAWMAAAQSGVVQADQDSEGNRRRIWPSLLFIGLLLLYGESLLGVRRRAWSELLQKVRNRQAAGPSL